MNHKKDLLRGLWGVIRIGFWGPLLYNDNKEPPKSHR